MITFLSIPRAFHGEHYVNQRRAIQSWQANAPGCQVMLFGDEPGTARACREMGLVQCADLRYHAQGSPLADRAFALGARYATHDWLCFTSADIVFDCDFAAIVERLRDVDRPFVIGQRRDVESGDGLTGYVLHAPCGVDYFLYRRGTVGSVLRPVLPFTVRGGVGDNWLVWKALTTWHMTVIDATWSILAYHYPHGHPEWEQGKRGREGSVEQCYNHALARADGMTRMCGVDSAPWVLRDGQLTERAREMA